MKLSISIHAPRAGCDPGQIGTAIYQDSDFNPRTPCGVRPSSCGAAPVDGVFQSTHPVRGATRPCRGAPESRLSISIHAPRAGCDKKTKAATIILLISIHAPRAGCDDVLTGDVSFENVFQSTHPVRGATRFASATEATRKFQSTHPVRGATRCREGKGARGQAISIHAPRAGCDMRPPLRSSPGYRQRHPGLCRVQVGKCPSWNRRGRTARS